MRSTRLLPLALGASAALAGLAGLGAPAAGAAAPSPYTPATVVSDDGPVVATLAVGDAVPERLRGGPCYRGDVEVVQPQGFVVRLQRAQDHDVVVAVDLAGGPSTDVVYPARHEVVTVPAGQTSASLPRGGALEGQVSPARWSATLLAGDGYRTGGTTTQTFQGLSPASPAEAGAPCGIADGTEHLQLRVGDDEPYWQLMSMWQVREFTLTDGTVPPGMQVSEEEGLSGTPTQAGTWTLSVRECPFPAVGDRICGTTRFTVEATGPGAPHARPVPTPAPEPTSTTAPADPVTTVDSTADPTVLDAVAPVAAHPTGGRADAGPGAATAAGVAGIGAAAAATAAVLVRRRSG
jgi:hypothetical protein